jgi:hypothetical protein
MEKKDASFPLALLSQNKQVVVTYALPRTDREGFEYKKIEGSLIAIDANLNVIIRTAMGRTLYIRGHRVIEIEG